MRFKCLFVFLLFFSLFSVVASGEDCPEIVDQQQSSGGTLAGFGEFDISDDKEGVRYRGQGFTPELPVLTAIKFNLESVGFTDLRVFIDTADENYLPKHGINEAIFSWTIPNSELVVGLNKYDLPQELNLTVGTKYGIYFAPYKNGEYCDDYRNMFWSLGNPYCGGDGVVNVNGCWIVSDFGDIDLQFETYGRECSVTPTPNPTPTATGQEPTPIPTPTDDGGGGGDDGGGGGGGGKELRVISTSPTGGATDIDPDLNKIEVNFNLAMDESGFITASAMVLKEKESDTEITLSYAVVSYGGKVSFYLTSGSLASGVKYEATIIKDRVKAGVGETPTLKEDYIWTFTTEAQPTPTPTVTTEPTPSPSPNPSPTSSASPTPTPIPTPSAEPSPSPIFTPTPTPSSEGVIYGRVRSIHDNSPLGGVKVSLTKRKDGVWKKYAETKTAKNGKYRFENLPEGRYKLRFTKPPYWLPLTRNVRLKEGGKKKVNILLDP